MEISWLESIFRISINFNSTVIDDNHIIINIEIGIIMIFMFSSDIYITAIFKPCAALTKSVETPNRPGFKRFRPFHFCIGFICSKFSQDQPFPHLISHHRRIRLPESRASPLQKLFFRNIIFHPSSLILIPSSTLKRRNYLYFIFLKCSSALSKLSRPRIHLSFPSTKK